jgi:hypothetical protein
MAVGATFMRQRLRPQGVIAHGLLAGGSVSEIEFFFRSLYVNTDVLAEVVVDVPDPQGQGLLTATPAPIDRPRPARVQEVAIRCGWDHILTQRLSPGRSGMLFRKRVLTDSELVPVVTDLISNLQRIHTIEQELTAIQRRLDEEGVRRRPKTSQIGEMDLDSVEAWKKRAEAAERKLKRLRNRRSVKLALALARPTRGVFRAVRSWKRNR